MPAVVRGGRRQSSKPAPRKPAPRRGAGSRAGARKAPTGKLSAFGSLDLSPRAAAISLGVGLALVAGVIFTGPRAERIGASLNDGFHGRLAAMGLRLDQVHIQGASAEAAPAIRAALDLTVGQPITGIDLEAVRAQVEAVNWVEEARVVRLLPDTLVIAVTEYDRLAVWQTGGEAYVIDGDGQVIQGARAANYPQLPLVVGAGAEIAAGEVLPLLAQRPALMRRVEALVRVDERRWDLRLKDGSLIQLPATGEEAALIQLDALDQRERLLDLGFARVDLRTPGAIAVRPDGEGGSEA